jgi:hypothetical protein
MKAAGMLLIIFGHIIGDPEHIYNEMTQPTFTKQIGVALFVFITGWGLANNTRPPIKAVFNRIFPFYFYGISFALLLSLIFYFTKGDVNASNYMPFIFGINVIFDFFPANPTIWYIGTYLHILLFWLFIMQDREVILKHVAIAFIIENIVRCALMAWEKDFVAYMLLPNWLTVFLLGMHLHRKQQLQTSPAVIILMIAWAAVLAFQTHVMNLIGFDHSFPFRNMNIDAPMILPIESILISCTYIIHTLFFFEIARRIPGFSLVSLIARGTLITVIIHMPIIYETHELFYSLFDSVDNARLAFIFTVYFGTAIIAEVINRSVDIRYYGDRIWNASTNWLDRLGITR